MKKSRKRFNFAVVLLILVGFPAVSFMYLQDGADYRREALGTMGDFGKMPDLSAYKVIEGELPDSLRGAMTVVGWLDPTKEEGTAVYGQMLDSLYQQFKDSPNLYFVTMTLAKEPVAAVDRFTEAYNLPVDPMLIYLQVGDTEFARSSDAFKLPLGQYDSPGIQPVVALVDSSLTVVEHYDLARRDETVGLVQLISLVIPLPEKQDVVIQPGKEL